jgi:hypothetical protein
MAASLSDACFALASFCELSRCCVAATTASSYSALVGPRSGQCLGDRVAHSRPSSLLPRTAAVVAPRMPTTPTDHHDGCRNGASGNSLKPASSLYRLSNCTASVLLPRAICGPWPRLSSDITIRRTAPRQRRRGLMCFVGDGVAMLYTLVAASWLGPCKCSAQYTAEPMPVPLRLPYPWPFEYWP